MWIIFKVINMPAVSIAEEVKKTIKQTKKVFKFRKL